MGDDALAALISEAKQISSSYPLHRISSIFQCIDRLLSPGDSRRGWEAVRVLRTFHIFPTRRDEARLRLQACEQHDDWFIADQPHLFETFHGHLNMLAFDAEDTARMGRFFDALHINDRLLSTAAICRPRPGLAFTVREDYKSLLMSRVEYISRLARNYGPQPPGISRLLRDIEVRSVDEVHVEWVVRSPSQKTIEHYADRRLALIVKNNNRAQLYIRHRDADARNLQFELSEQLSQLCGVPLEHTSLLWAALLLKNIELLDNALDRGGILRAINCSNVNVEVDRPSSRSNSSTRESEITEVTRSIASRDYKSLVSEKSDNAVTLSRTESDVPYMCRGETRVAMNYNKESFIRQWQQISARAQLHSDDNNPLGSISMHGAPWRERTTAKSTGASELSSVPRSPASETYGRRRNVPSGRISGDQISDIGSWELDHQDGRSIAQVTDSHYPNRAPKSSTTPHMIFCSTMKELPEMDVDGRNISGQATLPARLQVLDNGVQTVFIARNITTLIDHEPAFLGEVFVCEFLRHVLGSAYNPEKHWTSPLRSRCGHAPLPAPDNAPLSSFYIDASTGRAMTEFLKTKSIKHAEHWDFSPPEYHIDVQTTVDDISASFTWSVLNFDMARRWRVRGSSQHQGCIYILIRVSNIYEDPKVRMFVDPWDMIEEGELLIKSSSNLVANIHNGAHSGIELIDFQNKKPPQPDSFVSQISLYTTLAISGQRSTVNSNVYVWKPLKEPARHIRLLHLLPGKGIEDLRGDLIISAITDRVEYDAISYTWGSALQPFTLHTTEGNIPITTSLYVALMRMRKHKEAIWLWVDAICINQKDDIEKAAQISMMPDIFRSATRVYAWIGEEGDGSSEVIETLKQIAKQRLEPTMPSSNRYQDIPPLGRIFWNNLGKLLERKWFRRIWIVQEIVLARDIMVLCGKESVPWGQFCDMIRLCFDYAKQCSSGLVLSRGSSTGSVLRLAKFRRECRENGEFEARYPLLSLFEHFQLTEATRRRDKLFALLNLASDNCEELGPDYKAPLEDIIWRYACTFVKNGHVMELLYRSGRSSDPRFPSWVPDWTSAPYPRTLSKWKCKTKPHRFTAATRFLVYGQLGFEKVLSLRGHLVDSVSRVGVCPSYTSVFPAYLLETSTIVDECLPNLTRAEAAIVKRRLPIGDSDMVPEEERTLCQESIHDSHHAEPNITGFPGVTQEYIAIASEFADFFSPAVACCTVMGKLGIVPAKTRVGDRIAVFRSGRVPFILREKEMLRDHYEVIGECYIDGMMHGEYIEQSAQYQDINLV